MSTHTHTRWYIKLNKETEGEERKEKQTNTKYMTDTIIEAVYLLQRKHEGNI